MLIQEVYETDLGDAGATTRLREILEKVVQREQIQMTAKVTHDFRQMLMREAYLLPPFDTQHCFDEYMERVLWRLNFENPVVLVLRFLRAIEC